MRRAVQMAWALTLSILAAALLPMVAVAAPQATLTAKLQPGNPGATGAVSIAFHLQPGRGEALPSLSDFALRMPAGMGFAASQLGLATCSSSRLLSSGAEGCPHESLMGYGSAQVRVPFGAQTVGEAARVFIFMAKPVDERTTTLFYFDGRSPVIAPIVLQSQVVTPEGSSESVLETPVQAIPSTPDGPEASLVALRSTLGPLSLRYHRRVDGHRVPYWPGGISIPARCPRGGFRFEARFTFRDGSKMRTDTIAPCPRVHGRPARGRDEGAGR